MEDIIESTVRRAHNLGKRRKHVCAAAAGGREAVYTVVKHRTGTAIADTAAAVAAGTIYLDLYASHTCAGASE